MPIIVGKTIFIGVIILGGIACILSGIKTFIDEPFGGGGLVVLGAVVVVLAIGLAFSN